MFQVAMVKGIQWVRQRSPIYCQWRVTKTRWLHLTKVGAALLLPYQAFLTVNGEKEAVEAPWQLAKSGGAKPCSRGEDGGSQMRGSVTG
jgi:hypothetical protein